MSKITEQVEGIERIIEFALTEREEMKDCGDDDAWQEAQEDITYINNNRALIVSAPELLEKMKDIETILKRNGEGTLSDKVALGRINTLVRIVMGNIRKAVR